MADHEDSADPRAHSADRAAHGGANRAAGQAAYGTTDGAADGATDGAADGATDGAADGATDGAADRTAGPGGDVYDWYQRGLDLLTTGEAAAAAQLLAHAARAEPESRSIREALSRAHFDSGRYAEALESFRALVDANPDDDYAHFGLGLAAQRLGDLTTAAEHLALAAAMRPDNTHYSNALRGVRATRRARRASSS